MKNLKTSMFSVLILCFLFACDKDNESIPITIYESIDQSNGWVTADSEGNTFEAGGEVVLIMEEDSVVQFAVHFRTQSPEGFFREMYVLRSIPYKKGMFSIVHRNNIQNGLASAGFNPVEDDGDLIGSRYNVNESQNNFIHVEEINEAKNFIRGTFEVHFKLENGQEPPSTHPKKFGLINGKFEMKIER